MENKHTAGPWATVKDNKGIPIVGTKRSYTTAPLNDLIVEVNSASFSAKENEANAHLIAAAPDLLGALKAVHISLINDDDYMKHKPLLETINQALAKAGGK